MHPDSPADSHEQTPSASASTRHTVCVIDDDALVVQSLSVIINAAPAFQVVGSSSQAADAVGLYRRHRPDLLVLDIRMPEISGIAIAEDILRLDPKARILFLTTFLDDEYILAAMRLGAKGYLLKQDYQGLVPALSAIISGQTVYGSQVSSKIPTLKSNRDDTWAALLESAGITEREAEIIRAVAQGQNNKEISRTLHLSEGSVRNRLSLILEKLQLRDRTQLAVYYYQNGGT